MSDLNRSISVYLDGSDLQRGAQQVQTAIDKLTGKLNQLKQAGDSTSAEFKKTQSELKKNQTAMETYKNKVAATERVLKNLSGATLKELNAVSSALKKEINGLERGTDTYRKKVELLNKVERERKGAMMELNSAQGAQNSTLSRAANGFNKYFGVVTAGLASITGLSFAFRKLAEDVAKMDDVYADVMKTTGLTRDQVLDLNESFKLIDTRTSREDLNKLAEEAGKLGIEGKKNILDFVDAGNQIKVALGEDLGEDAIKNIGKMVGVFKNSTKELQNLDLKGQMLAVGSAVNQLGASSSASEDYLVQFAGRLGGVATQAGIGMDSILGFASALDQDMQQVEMSSTALQQFIMKLMGDPAKFAKLAGLNVKEFSNLLNTDANAAIKQVLRSLNDKGGFQALIPIFQEIGLDGARATGVLSSMANSIDKIDEAQRVANLAMVEGTSITKEYETKNNNLAAKLDKAKKAFTEQALALGQTLTPALLKSTNATTYLIKGLSNIVPFLKKYGTVILSVLASIVLYSAAMKANAVLQSIIAGLTKKNLILENLKVLALRAKILVTGQATQAELRLIAVTKASNAALSSTVWGVVAVAIGFAVGKLIEYYKESQKLSNIQEIANEALKETAELTKQYSNTILEEKSNLQSLVSSITSANEGSELRSSLIKKLQSDYPDFLGNIDKEKISNNLLVAAMTAVNEQYELKLKNAAITAKMEAQNALGVKYTQRQYEVQQEILKLQNGINTATDRDERIKKIQVLNKEYTNLQKNINIIIKNAAVFQTKISGNNQEEDRKKGLEYQIKQLNTFQNALKDARNKYESAVTTGDGEQQEFYKQKMKEANGQIAYANLKISQLKTAAENLNNANNKNDKNKDTAELSPEETEAQQDAALKALEKANQDVISSLKLRRLTELDVEIDFDKLMLAQKLAYLNAKLKLEQNFGRDTNATQQQLYDSEYDLLQELREAKERNDIQKILSREKDLGDVQATQVKIEDVQAKGVKHLNQLLEEDQINKEAAHDKDVERQVAIAELYGGAIGQFGSMLGDFLTNQEMTTKEFAKNMILMALDVLEKQIIINVAAASASSLASTESVATWGIAGAAKAALISGLIMAAFGGVKAAVSNSFAEGGFNFGETGGYTGNGGRYQVAGRLSNGAAVHKSEYVIAAPELRNPRIMNAALAIESIRKKRTSVNSVQGFAEGGFNTNYQTQDSSMLIAMFDKLSKKLEQPLNVYTEGRRSINEQAALIAKMNKNKSRNL